ncbi:hypothetical protein [Hoeflea poritis]|uniref:Uncharacterized protein n=1 Tax=Hoeflea poritis TaxID=2993659 RepID=A0ABT4VP56_9HYPH|nr:hypothetical protein [Hoeflea poritis]MDA4845925.1 hypothetical protein [Hoeflea poritis]
MDKTELNSVRELVDHFGGRKEFVAETPYTPGETSDALRREYFPAANFNRDQQFFASRNIVLPPDLWRQKPVVTPELASEQGDTATV